MCGRSPVMFVCYIFGCFFWEKMWFCDPMIRLLMSCVIERYCVCREWIRFCWCCDCLPDLYPERRLKYKLTHSTSCHVIVIPIWLPIHLLPLLIPILYWIWLQIILSGFYPFTYTGNQWVIWIVSRLTFVLFPFFLLISVLIFFLLILLIAMIADCKLYRVLDHMIWRDIYIPSGGYFVIHPFWSSPINCVGKGDDRIID